MGAGTDIHRALGKALGVVATDINGDGLMDLFVANDTVQNFLFANRGKGKWDEIGLAAEVGFSANGQPRSGMGVDAADINGDGRQDLFVANVDQELFSLYRNDGNEAFTDVANPNGVAQATRLLSGWGLKFFDYDNDGFVDLFLANGHPDDMVENYSQQVRYKEPLLLFHHDGTKLSNVSQEAGPVFQKVFSARGLAVGDYNNDGRIDVLIGNNGGAPVLLKNNAGEGNHWVGVRLQGTTCNRDAIGATITWSVNGKVRSRYKANGGSYLSSHDMREVLGLGTATNVEWIEIKWPRPAARSSESPICPSIATSPSSKAKGASRDDDVRLESARRRANICRPVPRHAFDAHVSAPADAHLQRHDVLPLRLRRDFRDDVRDVGRRDRGVPAPDGLRSGARDPPPGAWLGLVRGDNRAQLPDPSGDTVPDRAVSRERVCPGSDLRGLVGAIRAERCRGVARADALSVAGERVVCRRSHWRRARVPGRRPDAAADRRADGGARHRRGDGGGRHSVCQRDRDQWSSQPPAADRVCRAGARPDGRGSRSRRCRTAQRRLAPLDVGEGPIRGEAAR